MAKTRRKYKGGAVTTTISAPLSAGSTSIQIGSATGWPTSGPFYVVIDPGTATEEKILVGSISSTTLSSMTRGVDDTSDVSHVSGAVIYPVFTAVDADEANELTSKWTTKGDLVTHGTSTFETLTAGSNNTVLVADSAQSGGLKWSTIVDANVSASAAIADTKLDTISTANKVSAPALNIAGATAIGADLADADAIVVYDDSATANRNTAISRFAKFLFSKVSGDITITDAGVATIGSGKVVEADIADGAVTSAKLGPTSVNSQTGTSYTLVLADANKTVDMSNTGAITLTVPTNASVAFPTGTNINVLQSNTGQVRVSGSGVTFRAAVGQNTRVQWSVLTLYKRGTNEWVVFGDATPANV